MENELIKELIENSVSENLIDKIISSGYILRSFVDPFSGKTYKMVSDKLYGTKQQSSSFQIKEFINYANGKDIIEKFRGFHTYEVKNIDEISEILNDSRRKKLIENGYMSFRGQSKEYKLTREIPNPFRGDSEGKEISILPGKYRQNGKFFKFEKKIIEAKFSFFPDNGFSISRYLRFLEPNNETFVDPHFSHDLMRVEQHYANQTEGLDIGFDISTALFFSTYKFNWRDDDSAFHTKIPKGEHEGVIYCFRFRDPPVKRSEFFINNFNFFQTFRPERIIRQNCGLPLIMDYEQNIAVCDIDCIIYLHNEFDYEQGKKPKEMFPDEHEDKFYSKLIELKNRFPDELKSVVRYSNE